MTAGEKLAGCVTLLLKQYRMRLLHPPSQWPLEPAPPSPVIAHGLFFGQSEAAPLPQPT